MKCSPDRVHINTDTISFYLSEETPLAVLPHKMVYSHTLLINYITPNAFADSYRILCLYIHIVYIVFEYTSQKYLS